MQDVIDLALSDLSTADQERLVAGVTWAESAARSGADWSGRMIAELRRRGLSWSQLVVLTGVPQTTLYRHARPYLPLADTA
jgi:hypothetical protein